MAYHIRIFTEGMIPIPLSPEAKASYQRPKPDRLALKVRPLVAQGRSYRLVGREVGLSKNTVEHRPAGSVGIIRDFA